MRDRILEPLPVNGSPGDVNAEFASHLSIKNFMPTRGANRHTTSSHHRGTVINVDQRRSQYPFVCDCRLGLSYDVFSCFARI